MRFRQSTMQSGDNHPAMYIVPQPLHQPRATERFTDTVSRDRFVNAMRGTVTGVNIVTTDGTAGRLGVTVSAFASVSAEPPMVLVCINRRSPVAAALAANRCFAVNVLAEAQRDLADIFAGISANKKPYDFGAGRWNIFATGAPTLSGSVASLDCALTTTVSAGTHQIFIGRVVDVTTATAAPLLYSNRTYGGLSR